MIPGPISLHRQGEVEADGINLHERREVVGQWSPSAGYKHIMKFFTMAMGDSPATGMDPGRAIVLFPESFKEGGILPRYHLPDLVRSLSLAPKQAFQLVVLKEETQAVGLGF